MVWACPACTFENEDQLFSCEICSSQKYHDGDELDDGEYDHYNDEVDEIQWDVDDAQEFDPERVDQQYAETPCFCLYVFPSQGKTGCFFR